MIRVQTEDVDIGALIAAAKVPGTGAVVVFDGIVRDDGITEMELEAYGDVAVAEMEEIARKAAGLFRLLHVDIIHRIGRLSIGANIL
ncbi:MAG TPA: molybdenum cofactor biosynthesis protein MoaE, partial [Methanoregula sp.]|nr:molybdenum cofactor biosynthesis protein MoaE [Methanoregula sp.]